MGHDLYFHPLGSVILVTVSLPPRLGGGCHKTSRSCVTLDSIKGPVQEPSCFPLAAGWEWKLQISRQQRESHSWSSHTGATWAPGNLQHIRCPLEMGCPVGEWIETPSQARTGPRTKFLEPLTCMKVLEHWNSKQCFTKYFVITNSF